MGASRTLLSGIAAALPHSFFSCGCFMDFVGVRVLVGLLWNSCWLEPGTEFDMPKDRATELANTKPRGEGKPAAFLQLLPDLTGRVIESAPIPSGPKILDAGENPRAPATLEVDELADCPSADKLKTVGIKSVETLQALVTAQGDGFGKFAKLAKDEAKAVSEWLEARRAV